MPGGGVHRFGEKDGKFRYPSDARLSRSRHTNSALRHLARLGLPGNKEKFGHCQTHSIKYSSKFCDNIVLNFICNAHVVHTQTSIADIRIQRCTKSRVRGCMNSSLLPEAAERRDHHATFGSPFNLSASLYATQTEVMDPVLRRGSTARRRPQSASVSSNQSTLRWAHYY